MGYCIVRDDDGHDYIIPSDKRQEWYDWLDEAYTSNDFSDQPEWTEPLGCSIDMVVFDDYRIERW